MRKWYDSQHFFFFIFCAWRATVKDSNNKKKKEGERGTQVGYTFFFFTHPQHKGRGGGRVASKKKKNPSTTNIKKDSSALPPEAHQREFFFFIFFFLLFRFCVCGVSFASRRTNAKGFTFFFFLIQIFYNGFGIKFFFFYHPFLQRCTCFPKGSRRWPCMSFFFFFFFFFGGREREREKQERGKYKDLIDFLQNRKVNGCHFFFFFEREKSTVQNPKGAWVPFFFFQFLVRGRTQRMKNIYIIIYNIIYIYIYRYIYIYFFTDPSWYFGG